MTEFFLKIVNMSISASWVVLAVLLLRLILKKAPKWINVVLWGIVGLRLVMPFSLESIFSLIPSPETVSPQIMTDKTPQINTGVPVINNVINPVISESFTPAPMDSANPLQIWIPILAVVWVIGIVGMFLYTAISFWRVKRKIGTAILLRDNIYQSENVVSPFVLGLIKPKIYLPFNMNEQSMAQVIAHENAHISRKDHLWKPLGFLILTLHWFNPLMWLGYVLLCRDIELACDEKVVKDFNIQQKADYSQALLSCSVNRRIIAACPLAFGEVGVKKRIKSVLNYKKPAFWIIVVSVVASIVVSVCFLTNPRTTLDDELSVFLDMQVAEYNYSEGHTDGNFIVMSHKILDVKKTFNKTTVYMWSMYMEYSCENGKIENESGSHVPIVITAKRTGKHGHYELVEYWEPRDGTYYAKDIAKKFPWYLHGKALNSQRYVDEQMEFCENAAKEYFKVDNTAGDDNSAENGEGVVHVSNSDYSDLEITVTFDEEKQIATDLTVFDPKTNKTIQRIKLDQYEAFTNEAVYIKDVNFDGEDDLIVPVSRAASAVYLSAYVWDTETKQYVYAPTFENLSNVALDTTRKLVLSSSSGDRTTTYKISVYDKRTKNFKVQKMLYYYPDNDENNMIYEEEIYKNGGWQIVKRFVKPLTSNYEMDSEVADYYGNHADWLLNSSIWENYLVGFEDLNDNSTEEPYDPYPMLEITDERIVKSQSKKKFNDIGISLTFPLDWKCFERHGEDGGAYFFQDAELGEECQLIFSVIAKESVPSDVYLNERTKSEYSQYLSEAGYKDAKIISFTKEKVGGYNCRKVVFTYSKENKKYTQIDFGYIVDDVRLCDLRITYPSNKNAEYENIFESIINSVEFATYENPTGVIFLDYFEDYNEYSKSIKASPYLEEYEFLGELSKNEFISVSEGTETFAIIPANNVTAVSVYKLEYDEELNNASNGDMLYNSSDVKPFVVKCNLSDIYTDVNIVLTTKDGKVIEFSPQLSLKDGKVEIVTKNKDLIADNTKY